MLVHEILFDYYDKSFKSQNLKIFFLRWFIINVKCPVLMISNCG